MHPHRSPVSLLLLLLGLSLPSVACNYDFSKSKLFRDAAPACGNGVVEAGEACDQSDLAGSDCAGLGFLEGTLGCSADCSFDTTACIAACGNGLNDPGEECDDGQAQGGDGCSSQCEVEAGWVCSTLSEPSICSRTCGNSEITADEECDDGNAVSGDGCSAICEVEPGWVCAGQPVSICHLCGDGVCLVQGGESPATCPADCGWSMVSAGRFHSCGLKSDGTAWCWGRNDRGEVGVGATVNPLLDPTHVDSLSNVVALVAADAHTCATDELGTGWCWGLNPNGQLGDGSIIDSDVPVQVDFPGRWTRVFPGRQHSCGLDDVGAVWCWGDNTFGQLGNGTNISATTPAQVIGLSGIQQLQAGEEHSCAVDLSNDAWCWGRNAFGQLGDGGLVNSNLPVQVMGPLGPAIQAGAGDDHSCGRDTSQTAWCWGRASHGQLGDGLQVDSMVPVQVASLGAVAQIAPGGHYSCALEQGGSVFCWGQNNQNQIGAGPTPQLFPVLIDTLTDVVSISAGQNHSCAIRTDASAWCWGHNSHGQCGDGTLLATQPVPVLVTDPY